MGDNLSRIFISFPITGLRSTWLKPALSASMYASMMIRLKVDAFMQDLKPEFTIVYNDNVEMLSIRHYTDDAIHKISSGREILLEQRTRSTVRIVVRKISLEL